MSVLAKEPLGSFMVRNSESQPGTLALSVCVPDTFHPLGITHYIINMLENGYQIKVSHMLFERSFLSSGVNCFYRTSPWVYSLCSLHSLLFTLYTV